MADILLMLVSVALGGMLGWFIALYIAQPEIKVSIEKPITPMSSKWGKYCPSCAGLKSRTLMDVAFSCSPLPRHCDVL